MDGTPDDIAFLASSSHRVGVLNALNQQPCDRDTLREETDASSPTMGRVLSAFEDRHWIERDDHTYSLTDLGEFVADRLTEFVDAMTLEERLRPVAPWLPYELEGFRIELLTDAVVSYPGPGYPYEPLARNEALLAETDTIRGFGMVLVKASVLEAFFDRVRSGLNVEMIYPPAGFESILAWNPAVVREAVQADNHISIYTMNSLLATGVEIDP